MEIETEIENKLMNYHIGQDFTNLRVEMRIKPPIYTSSPFIFLDGILNMLCVREALGEDLFYNLPTDKIVKTDLMLPYRIVDDIPACSVGIYPDNVRLVKNTIFKRFTDKEYYNVMSAAKLKGRIATNKGYFKDAVIYLPAVLADSIKWHINGDKKQIKRLLGYLSNLGKKSSVNSRNIIKTSITEVDYDYTWFDNEQRVMRPLPTDKIPFPMYEGLKIYKHSYKPPYWDKDNVVMCYMPKNQLSESV